MFLEELNWRIRENGINLRLSCIYFFQNISQLPDHCHKTQRISLSLRISRIYLGLRPLFQGSLSPSHILPSCNACCLPHPDKNTPKKQCVDSTLRKRAYKAFEWEAQPRFQGSLLPALRSERGRVGENPGNKVVRSKVCLSHAGGLTRRRLFLESARSAISCKAP